MSTLIRIAHSPDADDAFMHYAVVHGKVGTEGLRFAETLADIETLNQKAKEGLYEVTAVSLHAFAYLDGRYALLQLRRLARRRLRPGAVLARRPFAG